jgi:hypothetical protein
MDLNVDTLIDRILLSMIVDVQHFDNPHSTIWIILSVLDALASLNPFGSISELCYTRVFSAGLRDMYFFFFLYIEVENVHENLSCSYKVLGVPKMSVTEGLVKWLIVALVILINPSDIIILLEAYNLAFMIWLKYSSLEVFNNSDAFCVLC